MILQKITTACLAATIAASLLVNPVWADDENSWAVADNVLNVNNPLPEYEEIVIEEEPVVEWEGQFTDEEREFSYSYTAPRDGYYMLSIGDFTPNCEAEVSWKDPYGNTLDKTNVKLEEGQTYNISVNSNQNTHFKVTINQQKSTTDISGYVKVKDQIAFTWQHNYYLYKAKEDGTHVLSLTMTPNTRCSYAVYDSNESKVVECAGIDQFKPLCQIALNADETYLIDVYQYNYWPLGADLGYYTMFIGEKKSPVNIDGYTTIHDAFDYRYQINNYLFTAPVDGTYQIDCSGKHLWDFKLFNYETKEQIDIDSWEKECSLEEGIQYNLALYAPDDGISDYTINITYPSEAQAYLDQVASGAVETEADGTVEVDPKYAELEARNQELESELAALQEKYDLLTDILGDSGLQIDEND